MNGVLHRCGQFAVCAAELLEQHVSEPHVWFANIYGVHKLFDMVINRWLDVKDVSSLLGEMPNLIKKVKKVLEEDDPDIVVRQILPVAREAFLEYVRRCPICISSIAGDFSNDTAWL